MPYQSLLVLKDYQGKINHDCLIENTACENRKPKLRMACVGASSRNHTPLRTRQACIKGVLREFCKFLEYFLKEHLWATASNLPVRLSDSNESWAV